MKKRLRLIDLLIALSVVFYFGAHQSAFSQTAAKKSQNSSGSARTATAGKPNGAAHVYLLRGLMNIFSLGMDDLAQKINRAGVAATVHEHGDWQRLSDEIAAKYKAGNHGAIILIGHSLGADAVMLMGERIGTLGVPVALIVPFDGTRSLAATGNVARVMNITQRDYAYMKRGYGFRGELANVDVSGDESIGHISIDKSARLHAMVVNKVVSVVGKGGLEQQPNTSQAEGLPATPPLPKTPPVQEQPAAAETPPDNAAVVKLASATTAATYSLSAAAAAMPVITLSSSAKEQLLAPVSAPAFVASPAPVPSPAPVSSTPSAPAPKSSPTSSSSVITDLEFQQLAPRNQN